MNKNEKGITLIALIITIIVMLILVAVSVTVLIQSDLLGSAKKAGKDYGEAIKSEQNLKANIGGQEVDNLVDYVNELIHE